MTLQDFINDYFVNPIINSSGYNLVNTLVYAVLFVVGVTWLYKHLSKHFKFDYSFMKALTPYLLVMSALRVLEDLKFLTHSANPLELGFYFGTPGIYLLGALLIVGPLLAFKKLSSNYLKRYELFGWALFAPLALFYLWNAKTLFEYPFGPVQVVILTALLVLIPVYLLKRADSPLLKSNANKLVLMGGAADASSTAVALASYGYSEQHVLPQFFIDVTGTPYVFLLKALFVLLVLWYLDKEAKKGEEELNGFVKAAVYVLTLSPGFRNFLILLTLA